MNQDALELMAKAVDLMQTMVEQNTQLIQINHEQSAQINVLLDQLVEDGQDNQVSQTMNLDD
ncbi:hypothetical protein [Acinetobacter pollinis]|uniref:hypothetical protein n=1 Tax=Acinetobacter pollinis TaxID=2605270 RepID=UPI0018C27616|nr:hypothetical protein [Acinetobacter pollinis]MBF7693457.1 hypothetical protein [Acinetobacter pollinis]MBF7700969.1 hypothetical protein [Acinetobacter pollinis]